MTNREKINIMTDEELAEFLSDDNLPDKINHAVCDGQTTCPITGDRCGATIFGVDCQVKKEERILH